MRTWAIRGESHFAQIGHLFRTGTVINRRDATEDEDREREERG